VRWIPAIPAGMDGLAQIVVYKDECWSVGTITFLIDHKPIAIQLFSRIIPLFHHLNINNKKKMTDE